MRTGPPLFILIILALLIIVSLLLATDGMRQPAPRGTVVAPPLSQQATNPVTAVSLIVPATPIPDPPVSQSAPTTLPVIPTHTVTSIHTITAVTMPPPTVTATTYPFATLDGALPTPATAVPTPVPAFHKPAHVINIVLLGNDVRWAQGGRTDTIIIVSLDQQTKTATLITLPRDLYVVVPGWKMARLNLALPHGHGANYPGGGGELIKDTILYNFGIPVDYYIRIGYSGFKEIIDTLGGLEIVVNCPLHDWRLISPELDETVEDNWEQFTLETGVHTLDGEMALWYARSRRTTNDFERGRRQQQLLRAMLNRGVDGDLIRLIPTLWAGYQEMVETDMSLPLMVRLASLAPEVRANGLQHLYLSGEAVRAWRVPETGEAAQLLQWPQAEPILQQLMEPPALNRVTRPPILVEVVTADYIMYRQVAENLSWYGFVPVYGRAEAPAPAQTAIRYDGDNFKGSFDWLLSWIFHQDRAAIALMPGDENGRHGYHVILGNDHNPCRPHLEAPRGP